MKQYICIIIRTECKEMLSKKYDNDKECKDLLYINPSTYPGMCARRYHVIYCDKNFLKDKIGQSFIKLIVKPMATARNEKGIIFI